MPANTPTRHIAIAMQVEEAYPQHQDVYNGILQYARERGGWQCSIDQYPTYKPNQRKHVYQYDGVIARATPQLQKRLRSVGVPFVNTHFQAHRQETFGVYPDPVAVGKLAAEHLLERGFKRFASLNYENYRHSALAIDAFEKHIRHYGMTCMGVQEINADNDNLAAWLAMEKNINAWIDSLKPPIGTFIHAEFNARMVCQLAPHHGLHIPQDLSVLCLMNQRSVLEVTPQISSVDMNYNRIGYEAAGMLDKLIERKAVEQRQVYVPPLRVIARESTNYHSVDDPLIADALRYISANISNKIVLEDIAYELAVSRRKLQMRFSEVLGRSVSDEIRRLRLSTVKIRLADAEQSIEDIAHQTGFASAGALWDTFKREVGVSPSDYRRELMGES